jgi:hypothetical protein
MDSNTVSHEVPQPSIVTPVILDDDAIISINWKTLLMFAEAFVADHHGNPDHAMAHVADWGFNLAMSIVKMGGE